MAQAAMGVTISLAVI